MDAEGYLFFSEPPPPPSVGSRGSRGTVGRGGRKAHGGGRISGPGRGRKSEATKAADQAKLAAFLAAKYPKTSRFAAAAYDGAGASSSVDSDEVEFMGDKTWAELRRSAMRSCGARPSASRWTTGTLRTEKSAHGTALARCSCEPGCTKRTEGLMHGTRMYSVRGRASACAARNAPQAFFLCLAGKRR